MSDDQSKGAGERCMGVLVAHFDGSRCPQCGVTGGRMPGTWCQPPAPDTGREVSDVERLAVLRPIFGDKAEDRLRYDLTDISLPILDHAVQLTRERDALRAMLDRIALVVASELGNEECLADGVEALEEERAAAEAERDALRAELESLRGRIRTAYYVGVKIGKAFESIARDGIDLAKYPDTEADDGE